jgi:hypothetical protein
VLYENAFNWVPRNTIINSKGKTVASHILPTWDDTKEAPAKSNWGDKGQLMCPMPFQAEFWERRRHTIDGLGGLEGTEGFISALPTDWTCNENNLFEFPASLVSQDEDSHGKDGSAVAA